MPHKQLLFAASPREKILRGATAPADAVRVRLGPKSKFVLIEREQVATISAHDDKRIGALVADAVDKVGSEGVISVEEAKATETALEVVQGMQFDRGCSASEHCGPRRGLR